MGTIVAVCASSKKHEQKHEVDEAEIREGHGLVGDAHGGSERQVSLLAMEHIDTMRRDLPTLAPGAFAENLTTVGIALETLRIGTRLRAGSGCLLEITQIGKKCHNKCTIHKQVGYCIMPTKGVFARVVAGGMVKKGDSITVIG
ncbi:MAG: MOSC domain-containing protein [Desulfovibrionaceae bacterium]